MSFDQCCNVAVVRSDDQITFPVTWDSPILDLGRAFTDWDRILDLSQLQPLLRSCDTRSSSSFGCLRINHPAICCGDHFSRSFRAMTRHKGSLKESLQALGRFAQSHAR